MEQHWHVDGLVASVVSTVSWAMGGCGSISWREIMHASVFCTTCSLLKLTADVPMYIESALVTEQEHKKRRQPSPQSEKDEYEIWCSSRMWDNDTLYRVLNWSLKFSLPSNVTQRDLFLLNRAFVDSAASTDEILKRPWARWTVENRTASDLFRLNARLSFANYWCRAVTQFLGLH